MLTFIMGGVTLNIFVVIAAKILWQIYSKLDKNGGRITKTRASILRFMQTVGEFLTD